MHHDAMTKALIITLGISVLSSSCVLFKKPVTSAEVIGVTPTQSGPVNSKPTQGAISDTGVALGNTGDALARAESEAAAAKREADQAQGVILSYEDLVGDLRATNTIMADKFAELGRKHKELETMRLHTIERLSGNLVSTRRALVEAKTANDTARARIFILEGETQAQTIEVSEYRKNHKVLAQALKDAETTYAKDVARERKKADKAVKDNAKYKGYYDMFWKFVWIGLGIVVLIGIFAYVKYFTPAGMILRKPF